MDVPITFVPHGHRSRDVVVQFDASTTVSALARELEIAASTGTSSIGPLFLGERLLEQEQQVVDAGLAAGAILSAGPEAAPARHAAAASTTGLELAVIGGLSAGGSLPLQRGELSIGRAEGCDVVLHDDLVSRLHAKIVVADDGTISIEDLDSANGTLVNGSAIAERTVIRESDIVEVGSSLLAVVAVDRRPADVEPTGDGRVRYNKPPRAVPQAEEATIAVPEEPEAPSGLHLPLGTVLAPLLLGPLFYLFTRSSPALLLLMLGTPLIACLNAFLDRRSGRRKYKKKLAEYEKAMGTFGERLAEAVRADEQARRAAFPDPATLSVIAATPTGRLWERRASDGDSLVVRVGLRDMPANVKVAGRAGQDMDLPPARMVPVTVPVGSAGVVGLAGPRAEALAMVRSMVLQLATLHTPNDVSVVVLSDGDPEDWEWAKWLPHTQPRRNEQCTRLFGMTPRQRDVRLAELAKLIREGSGARRALGAGAGGSTGTAGSSRPVTVVVLDGIRRLRGDEAVAHLLKDGPAAGVVSISVSDDLASLPAETVVSVQLGRSASEDPVAAVAQGGNVVRDVFAEGVTAEHAETVARALAPLFEVAGTSEGRSALPSASVDQLAILGVPSPTPDAVLRRWQQTSRAEAKGAVGVDVAGPLTVDLVKDGPHALIAGTTGAGKSELLQTLVASLALTARPDALTFLLVDFKGRSAFKDCEALPHTVGVLSNLDGRLVERALDAIQAELRWRETELSRAGARDFEEYERVNRGADGKRIPRLVIVVDELKELADAYGQSVPRLNQTARLGRGLGVHLVLATQKPASVPGLADLRANTDLRICLRVQDEADSRDLIGVPDAAAIPRGAPGRAIARMSDGRVVAFQAGYLGDALGQEPKARRVPTAVRSFTAATVGEPLPSPLRFATAGAQPVGPTKLQALVEAMGEAARQLSLPAPRRPWLPPLPAAVTLDDPRLDQPVAGAGAGAGDRGAAAFAVGLLDIPAEQRQEPLVFDFDEVGHVLVSGRTRSGRTTVLRTLGGAVGARSSPGDVHLYGLEFRRRSLQDLERLPHCGGVAGADDPERMERKLDLLHAEIDRRGQVMGSCGSLLEHRQTTPRDRQLPYVIVLCDNYESFYERFSYEDGGRLVERFDWLLREGPARGIHFVVTADQRAAMHRLSAIVDAQLVLRPTDQDAPPALGAIVRGGLADMPPGRGFWMAGPHEAQVALLTASASGEAQARALVELAGKASAAAQGLPRERLPARVGALPASVTIGQAEALRRRPRAAGRPVATFTVGGLDVQPIDVDLAAAGYTFLVAGPRGSGRSTALLCMVVSLVRDAGVRPVCIVAPRKSPLHALSAWSAHGVTVLTSADSLSTELGPAVEGARLLVVDDAELLLDNAASFQLDQLVRRASDDERIVVVAGTTVDLVRRFSGWTFEARQSRSGLVLQPSSATDGEILDLRLPRSTGGQGQAPPGRGVLAVRGRWVAAQVIFPKA
jgi:S-DNA-T family DNA segregation ATPase FtsK/SpoIIIE